MFLHIAMHNLVDSNVFLRACIVSLDQFEREDRAAAAVGCSA